MEILVGLGFVGIVFFLVIESLIKQAKGKIAVNNVFLIKK